MRKKRPKTKAVHCRKCADRDDYVQELERQLRFLKDKEQRLEHLEKIIPGLVDRIRMDNAFSEVVRACGKLDKSIESNAERVLTAFKRAGAAHKDD